MTGRYHDPDARDLDAQPEAACQAPPAVSHYPRRMHEGDIAPDFELPDENGTPRRLSGLVADGPVVLFFYPAAMTPGCTAESCHFRDMKAEFDAVGAQRIGISADAVEKQKRFSDKHSFDFPLLSDPDGAVATQYGVRRRFTALSPTKRATFVIGSDLKIVAVIQSEVRMNVHADRALEAVAKLSAH
jgi:peroxiredoxin Q/BCP